MLCFNCGRYWCVGYKTRQKPVSDRLYDLVCLPVHFDANEHGPVVICSIFDLQRQYVASRLVARPAATPRILTPAFGMPTDSSVFSEYDLRNLPILGIWFEELAYPMLIVFVSVTVLLVWHAGTESLQVIRSVDGGFADRENWVFGVQLRTRQQCEHNYGSRYPDKSFHHITPAMRCL